MDRLVTPGEQYSPGSFGFACTIDLRVLESEKASAAERAAEGVSAIVPAGAILGILMWTEPTKVKVATGEYNKMIDKRIAQIKDECGIR